MTPSPFLIDLYHSFFNYKRMFLGGENVKFTSWGAIELISLHIPKTAGTSFFHTLKKEYRPEKVVRIDINKKGVSLNKVPLKKAFIDKKPKVIHGHFTIENLTAQFSLPSSIPIITWLRDPVDRVISNYFYLSEKGNINTQNDISLLDFAKKEVYQNRMSKFLKGIPLEDFFFIGIVENYDNDVRELGQKLNWQQLEIVEYNRTDTRHKAPVDEATKAIIKSYNQKDQALYEQALSLRQLNI